MIGAGRVSPRLSGWGLLWIGTLGIGGCSSQPSAVSRPLSETASFAFEPKDLKIDGMFPGVIVRTVTLRNQGPATAKDVQIDTSCGCLELLEKKPIPEMKPGESTTFKVRISNDKLSPVHQAVFAVSKNASKRASLVVDAQMRAPVLGIDEAGVAVGKLPRLASSEVSESLSLTLPLDDGIRKVAVRSLVPWLKVQGTMKNGIYGLTVRAEPGAPEGPFLVAGSLEYASERQEGSVSIFLKGTVESSALVEPSTVSLGITRVGEVTDRSCSLTMPEGVPADIVIRSDDSSVEVTPQRIDAQRLRLAIKVHPTEKGEIKSTIRLSSKGVSIGGFTVTGYVM